MIKFLKTIFLTLLFILGITFSVENTQTFVLRYYFGLQSPPIPLFLLVLISVFVGVVLAGVGYIVDLGSLRRAVREKDREIDGLQRELQSRRGEGRAAQG